MADDDEDLPGIDEAKQAAEESERRAAEDWRAARARARSSLGIADRLRRLREENGFSVLLDDAFGGGGRA